MVPYFPLKRLILHRFLMVMMFIASSLRTESQIFGPIMAQLLSNSFHVLDVVRTSICSRSNWFVIFDAEVDAGDRVFTWQHSNLVGCLVVEARR